MMVDEKRKETFLSDDISFQLSITGKQDLSQPRMNILSQESLTGVLTVHHTSFILLAFDRTQMQTSGLFKC